MVFTTIIVKEDSSFVLYEAGVLVYSGITVPFKRIEGVTAKN